MELSLPKEQQVCVVSQPGWLEVWRCDCWLIVYRSPLVRDTDPMYQPVAEVLIGSGGYKIAYTDVRDDENMMFGRGEFALIKLEGE